MQNQKDIYFEAKNALLKVNKEAKDVGLDSMSMEEINAEIKAYRNGELCCSPIK